MARHSEQPIRTYAIGFAGGEAEALYNELPYARRVAELFGTEHREILVRPDVVACCRSCCGTWTNPLSDTAFITTFLVSEFAREDVKVILSGVGGDELFGGYRRYLGGHYAQALSQTAGVAARRQVWLPHACRPIATPVCSTGCAWPRASSPRPG
jgi:asparagine synthase (glutamine-hydrolysing)